MAEPFRREYGRQRPIYLVLGAESRVPEMFVGVFDKVFYEPQFNAPVEAWYEFYRALRLDYFGFNVPITLFFPLTNPETVFAERFAYENRLPWTQIYKSILRLPGDAKPGAPPSSDLLRAEAQAIADSQGIVIGRSVILSPHARATVVDATAHFALLARRLKEQGYAVFPTRARSRRRARSQHRYTSWQNWQVLPGGSLPYAAASAT